jgi:hypothetical protein
MSRLGYLSGRSGLESPHIDNMKTVLVIFVVLAAAAAEDAVQGKRSELLL